MLAWLHLFELAEIEHRFVTRHELIQLPNECHDPALVQVDVDAL
ncbi:hypothetical protein ACHAWF_002761 [Thalassiosira exigua]